MTPSRLAIGLALVSSAVLAFGVGLVYPPAGLITVGLAGLGFASAVLRGVRP